MYHFIVNLTSKGGKLKKAWPHLETHIKGQLTGEIRIHFTEYKGHATEIVKGLTSTTDPVSVIAVGGDGTVNEVVNGIVNHQVTTFGYIPFGSGMDFARGNNLPLNPMEAIELIIKGNTTKIKYSEVTVDRQFKRSFASNCGIGFDAEVAAGANSGKTGVKKLFNKLNLGTLTYVYYVMKNLFLFHRFTFNVFIDGQKRTYDKSWFVNFGNHPYIGGGMKMNPLANPKEPILNAIIASQLRRGQVLLLFPKIFKGTHIHHPRVELQKGREFVIESQTPLEVHVDGEGLGKCHQISVKLKEEQLNVYS